MRNPGVLFTGVLLAIGGSLGSPPTMAYAITGQRYQGLREGAR